MCFFEEVTKGGDVELLFCLTESWNSLLNEWSKKNLPAIIDS